MGARNRGGIGLSYRPARLHRLRRIHSLESIPGLHKRLKIRARSTDLFPIYVLASPGDAQHGLQQGGGGETEADDGGVAPHSQVRLNRQSHENYPNFKKKFTLIKQCFVLSDLQKLSFKL
jgi:hypothetical protein